MPDNTALCESLAARADRIEAWAEEHFIDPNGVVYTYLDKETSAPVSDAFFTDADDPFYVHICTPAEFHTYEDCGICTGAYLQSQLWRYAAEEKPESLSKARRCFKGLRHVYELGKELEEGFFPKAYGNKFTPQTSTDQVLYAVLALDHLHRYAETDEKAEIDRMISEMVRFWVKRDYKYTYYTIQDMPWPLARFPSLLLLAFRHSGDTLFRDEYNRLLEMGINRHPGESQLGPKLAGEVPPMPYEQRMHAWLVAHGADATTMDVMELDYLLSNDPENDWAGTWKQSIRQMWEEGMLPVCDDGRMYVQVLVDMDTHAVRRPEPGFFADEKEGDLDWVGFRYLSGARTAWSTGIARAGVQACRHLQDRAMVPAILNILRGIDVDGLTYCDDPERLLPEIRYKTRFYSGNAMGNWLWAYWQGRHEGIIDPSA